MAHLFHDRPALLALIGQTQIDNPKKLLPKVVSLLREVKDDETRGRLFTALLALMTDQEMISATNPRSTTNDEDKRINGHEVKYN